MGTFTKILALVYILIGLYLVNFHFKIISLGLSESIEGWIVLIGGIIILVHGLIFFMKRTKKTFESF